MLETIVLYAAPGMGHVISMVELGKFILLHRHQHHSTTGSDKFSIIILLSSGFWDTPNIFSYIHRISLSFPSISFRRFPPISISTSTSTPPPSRIALAFQSIRDNTPNVKQSLQQISTASKIRAFVIDMFCTSALSIAKQLDIPTYYFFTSGAACLSAFLYLPTIHEKITASFKDLPDTEIEFPNMPPLKATHMPEPTLDRSDPAYHDFVYFCSHLPKSNGILVNTFAELEPVAVKAIASGICVPGSEPPPVYCVGPLIASEGGDEGEDQDGKREECLDWLDNQPKGSVVFLCFGSRGSFSVKQVTEIANGLEQSGKRFLWVLKRPVMDEKVKQVEGEAIAFDLGSVLPEGFLEKTRNRGMVVKTWAPQVAVLGHEAVGGFVSHCGWNSVLEAVVNGVPMVAWPLYAEQHLNRNVLVGVMKVAIAVEMSEEEDGFVSGVELQRRVEELMELEAGREVRERSLEMKELAMAAKKDQFGSSVKALDALIEVWKKG